MSNDTNDKSKQSDPWANPRSMQSAEDEPATEPAAPAAAPAGGDLHQRVQQLLDELINPAVASHGGYIQLVEVKGNDVYVEMSGGCQGCGAATMTLKAGVERMLKEELSEIGEVIDVTDHTRGANPYY